MFLTTQEIAERYKISKAMVLKSVRNGTLPPAVRIGRVMRWNEKDLEAFEANA